MTVEGREMPPCLLAGGEKPWVVGGLLPISPQCFLWNGSLAYGEGAQLPELLKNPAVLVCGNCLCLWNKFTYTVNRWYREMMVKILYGFSDIVELQLAAAWNPKYFLREINLMFGNEGGDFYESVMAKKSDNTFPYQQLLWKGISFCKPQLSSSHFFYNRVGLWYSTVIIHVLYVLHCPICQKKVLSFILFYF